MDTKREQHELDWKNRIWTQVCYFLSLSFLAFFILKSYQQVANFFFIGLEGLLSIGLFLEYKNSSSKTENQLKKKTYTLLTILFVEAVLFSYFYPSYSLEKSYWLMVISLIAFFFLGKNIGIATMILCFLTHLGFLIRYGGLPNEVLQLGEMNQLLILLICMAFFFNIAQYLQDEFQFTKTGLKANLSILYSEWRKKLFEENIKNASATLSLLRHELNNPGAIISLSLQVLKKDSSLATLTDELQNLLLNMNQKLKSIESQLKNDSKEVTVDGIEKEIYYLNQVSEEKWSYRFVLFAQIISGLTALSIASYAVIRFGPDWFRLLNAVIFGFFCLISAYWTFTAKNAKKSIWLFSVAVYIQLMAPIFSQGGIFSNGIIWLAVAPYFFYLAMGAPASAGFRWVSAVGLGAFFFFGNSDALYVTNSVMRLVNFSFATIMVCGFGMFFENKRVQILSALIDLENRYHLKSNDLNTTSEVNTSGDILASIMADLLPQIQRAKVVADELQVKCQDPLVIKIAGAVDRMQRFSESIKK